MNEPILLSNDGRTIHKLIHLSDIHIRTGDPEKARYKEYQAVFEYLINELKTKDLTHTAFVITGDIFHHKGKIEPAGIKLTNYLFNQLLKLAPVVVICGNHDYRQDDPNIPDMIESLLETYQKRKPFYYLNKTGTYILNNVGFGVVDIRDTLKSYNTCGRIGNYADFPKCDTMTNVDYKVALFHGWVKNKEVQDDKFQYYPLNWFGGYSYILLGDIHKHQIHRHKDQTWGYPGSMIQQDFGETITGHGYIEWDLSTGTATHHNIYNPYGYCTLKKHQDEWYVHHHKKEWYTLKEVCQNELFPKQPMVRIKHTETDDVCDILKKYQIHPTKIIKTVLDVQEIEDIVTHENVTTHLEELNTPQKWIDYLQYHTQKDYSSYILNPESLKLPKECEELKKYTERNTKIQKTLDEYNSKQNYNNECLGERVELVHMTWNYLMCYGENNYLEFTNLKQQIALLNGKNAIGKSSFLDILCIGLYGEPTKMRHMISGKKYTGKIIHDHRPSNKNAPSVSILLKIKGTYYEIHRIFGIQSKDSHQIVQTLVTVSKVEPHTEMPSKYIICEGNAKVEEWIEKHIGNMESVLMSTMMCQTDLSNFFHLKQDDQKMILDTALHLENVSLYGKVLRESLLGHQDILTQLKTSMETVSKMIHSQTYDISSLDKQMAISQETVDKYNKIKEEWLIKIRQKNWKHITIPEDIQERYREVRDIYDYHFKKDQYEALQSKSDDMIRLEEKLNQCMSMLQLYEDDPIIKDAESKLQRWQDKYNAFLKKKPKCEVSIEWIESTKAKYEQWKQQQPKEWFSDTFQQTFEKDKDELWEKAVSKPTKKRPTVSLTIADDIVEQYHALMAKSCQKPNESKEDYLKWKKKYDKWYGVNKEFTKWESDEPVKEKLNKIQQKIQQIDKTEKELATIEKDIQQIEKEREFYKDLKFNPKCHECQTNPFNKKKQEMDTEYAELKPYGTQLLQHIEKLRENSKKYKYYEKETEYTQQLQLYQKYFLEKDYYEVENEKWEKTIQQLHEYETWSQQFETVESQYLLYQWQLYDEWDKAYTIAMKQYQTWDTFSKEKQEWTQTMETLEEQEAQWELLTTWQSEESVVREKLELYERSVQKKKYQTEYNALHQQYQAIQKDVENWKKLKSFKEDYEKCEEQYAIYKLHELEPLLCKAKEEMEKVKTEYIQAVTVREQQQQYKEQYQYYNELETIIQNRCEHIRELETYFMGDKTNNDGYKEWIYKDKVIPLLNKEMNQFLTQFEDFRFKMIYDKRQFIYMLEDRGNEPTLDKASGYQNLIVSLAFRLALTRIGAIGQQFKHLFIDEGFTACDTNNIEKVPILLKNIMDYGKYHSIILMSHLDSVRECSQTQIQIERQDPYSYIHYGAPYPKIQQIVMNNGIVVEKKPRGRKPKS